MLEDFDPHTIEDESLRRMFITLMNLVETLSVKVAEQAEEMRASARREQSAQGRTRQAEDLAQHQNQHRAVLRKRTSCV